MKRTSKLLIAIGCVLLLVISWLTTITSKSDLQKQRELIKKAKEYIGDEIYVKAEPLLEEAVSYSTKDLPEAESLLKQVYLNLSDTSGYQRKYTDFLELQMSRKSADEDIFEEAALYYFSRNKVKDALDILKRGIEQTSSEKLADLYEDSRYAFEFSQQTYHDASAIFGGASVVLQDGYWGLASKTGNLVVPCMYDAVSTYSEGEAIVRKGSLIYGIDSNNNRVALDHNNSSGFSNYTSGRLFLRTADGWVLANSSLKTQNTVYEDVGSFYGGYAPVKLQGKWGFIDTDGEIVKEPSFEAIAMDELGHAYNNKAYFAKLNGKYNLYVKGKQVGADYEDAKPFDGSLAAVKLNGKWGFVDLEGTTQIEYQFDDALSFGQHLAAVLVDDRWGYVNKKGEMVIEPQFFYAKSFNGGSAPVLTSDGWKFITLLEYKKEGGLL